MSSHFKNYENLSKELHEDKPFQYSFYVTAVPSYHNQYFYYYSFFNCLHTKSLLVTQFLKPDTQTPEPHQICKTIH